MNGGLQRSISRSCVCACGHTQTHERVHAFTHSAQCVHELRACTHLHHERIRKVDACRSDVDKHFALPDLRRRPLFHAQHPASDGERRVAESSANNRAHRSRFGACGRRLRSPLLAVAHLLGRACRTPSTTRVTETLAGIGRGGACVYGQVRRWRRSANQGAQRAVACLGPVP
eukprot:61265-Chlamydomonas_euryale.AAC.4